ncbi:MAG TPA: AMP-binding protein [Burkholderiaceae bacterium]|nr:AMP-binding protein [Burkholderiaceae bacterium]
MNDTVASAPARVISGGADAAQAAGAERPATLIDALNRNAARHPGEIAIRERDYGIWQEISWSGLRNDVLALAAALQARGITAGQAVTSIGDNRARLYIAMLALMTLRAFPVPVYPDVPPAELDHYTRHGEPDVALAEDQEQVDKLLDLRERIGRPRLIVYDDPRGLADYTAPGLASLDELLEQGRALLAATTGLADDLAGRARPDDHAVLLHSSGTTGVPKGIALTHANIISGVLNARACGHFEVGDRHYAYLPTAWVGDFVFTLGAGLALRFATHIPERQETVLHDLREVAPTMYLAAPRAWDNMLTRIQVGMEESTPLKRRLFHYFMPKAIALERKKLAGQTPGVGERLMRALAEVLVCAPLKDWLGLSKARRAFTGGEAMGEDTFVFFRALGVNLSQFYGQTETSALTAAQQDGDVKLHTVGKPMPGVSVRIADDGEIQVRSGSVFGGYFNDPTSTASAFTADGWFRTGDAGYLEDDGHLVVLGRVSEVVTTAGGERYVPNYIENRIKFSPYVRNVAVIGAGRDDLTAIVCIDFDAVGHWAEQRSLSYTSYAELSQLPEVAGLVRQVLRHVNGVLKPELAVRRFVNLHKDFDADDGEITRTRKLRRNIVEDRYRALIAALYDGSHTVDFEATITYESGETGVLKRRLSIEKV